MKIIPASFVRTLHNANKDDRNDSYWIWQALRSMNTGSIAVRSDEEQILQATFKLRELFVTQRTRQLNNLRALLYEMGEAVPLGQQKLLEHVAEFEAAQTERGCTGLADLTLLLNSARKALETQDELIEELTETIRSKAQEDQTCSLLMTIPGVGPLTAVALSLVMGKPENFRNARQFAAYAGFAPVHTGTGGKITVLGVSRRGKGILKKMLGEASMSVTCFKADTSPWIASLLERKPKRVVACAVANKICRIAWAICSSGKAYDYTKTNIGIPKGA